MCAGEWIHQEDDVQSCFSGRGSVSNTASMPRARGRRGRSDQSRDPPAYTAPTPQCPVCTLPTAALPGAHTHTVYAPNRTGTAAHSGERISRPRRRHHLLWARVNSSGCRTYGTPPHAGRARVPYQGHQVDHQRNPPAGMHRLSNGI